MNYKYGKTHSSEMKIWIILNSSKNKKAIVLVSFRLSIWSMQIQRETVRIHCVLRWISTKNTIQIKIKTRSIYIEINSIMTLHKNGENKFFELLARIYNVNVKTYSPSLSWNISFVFYQFLDDVDFFFESIVYTQRIENGVHRQKEQHYLLTGPKKAGIHRYFYTTWILYEFEPVGDNYWEMFSCFHLKKISNVSHAVTIHWQNLSKQCIYM